MNESRTGKAAVMVHTSKAAVMVHTSKAAVMVHTTCLDDFVEANGFARIDILKMDTEGAEGMIVEGELRRALPITQRVVMESHRMRDRVRELREPLGFRMVLDDRASHVVFFARPRLGDG